MGKDSSEIRREIEQTRARMGDTVEALSYKADVPSRVKDAVNERVETVKGTISDVVSNVKDALGGASDKVGTVLGGAKDKAGSTWSDAGDKLGAGTSGIGDKLHGVTDAMPSTSDVTSAAKRGVGIATENPLGLAIGAAAVGFLAGLLAPVTDYERNTIGPIRDDLVDKAQHVGSDVLEHGKAVLQETAQAALSTAQQSAQTHGQQVVDKVQDAQNGSNGHSQSQSQQQGGSAAPTAEYGVLLDDLKPGAPGSTPL